MSGGVDSSVAAALCLRAGYRVWGVMLRLWAEPDAESANRCCTPAAVEDAARVADQLGIGFHVLDARALFRRAVVDGYLDDAAAGDTPNPCFGCNDRMRFGYLLDTVRSLGADALATGHYARTEPTPGGTWRLLRGVDGSKDQSYVLHRLDQQQLSQAMFPVGQMTKAEVRRLAGTLGLPAASRPDSVDLCWVAEGGLAGFLGRYLPAGACAPGPIVDLDGREIGQHRGWPLYTVGQRRGLGVAAGRPLYVVRRDRGANTLVVGPLEALYATDVPVRDMHWIAGRAPPLPLRAEAQLRYRAAPAPATIEDAGASGALVRFDTPQWAPTPGQGMVVYDGDVCLGGGTIQGRGEDAGLPERLGRPSVADRRPA